MKEKTKILFSQLFDEPRKISRNNALFWKKSRIFSRNKIGSFPVLEYPVLENIKKKSLKNFAAGCGIALMAILPLVVSAQPPQLPHMFYGTATINGSPVSAGAIIVAKIDNVEKGRITVATAGRYGGPDVYDQKLLVQGNIDLGSVVSFQTGNLTAVQTGQFSSGDITNLNLSFESVVPATPAQGGGGGGGGGGGSSIPSTALSSTVKKGDATNDGKIDIFDFNVLMINWGKTNLGLAVDFNGDGKIDILDFNFLMVNWGK